MTKQEILKEAKKNPEQVLYILIKNDFKLAKSLWKNWKWYKKGNQSKNEQGLEVWQSHLQEMVISKDPIKYLEQFVK